MKDTENCPYCQSEERGCSESWGMSSAGWEELKRIHDIEHFELQKALDNLPDGTTVILPPVTIYSKKPIELKPNQSIQGYDHTVIGCHTSGDEKSISAPSGEQVGTVPF